ncbi:MAG: VOC family protein [Leptospira sp.]|nr:VOC family protein [Leptospira sp.]
MIHHIAIGTENPQILAEFYLKIPGTNLSKKFFYESGKLRSVWIECGSLLLMFETGKKEAPKALVLGLEGEIESWKIFLESTAIVQKTDFTYYFLDPDGNRLGLSTYPKNIRDILESG